MIQTPTTMGRAIPIIETKIDPIIIDSSSDITEHSAQPDCSRFRDYCVYDLVIASTENKIPPLAGRQPLDAEKFTSYIN
jgi:hypothetical protein